MGSPALSAWPPPSWEVPAFLGAHRDLSIVPGDDDALHIAGPLRTAVAGPDGRVVQLDYSIEIVVPPGHPRELPRVRETSGRIERGFHRIEDDFLCLGAPLRLLIQTAQSPSLEAFFRYAVLTYFLGHASWKQFGKMALGELPHGSAGLVVDYCDLLGARDAAECRRALTALGLRKRVANKQPCPCGSGVRLGRCHNLKFRGLRRRASRSMCREALRSIPDGVESPRVAPRRCVS